MNTIQGAAIGLGFLGITIALIAIVPALVRIARALESISQRTKE